VWKPAAVPRHGFIEYTANAFRTLGTAALHNEAVSASLQSISECLNFLF
jgi:hypothetical protein